MMDDRLLLAGLVVGVLVVAGMAAAATTTTVKVKTACVAGQKYLWYGSYLPSICGACNASSSDCDITIPLNATCSSNSSVVCTNVTNKLDAIYTKVLAQGADINAIGTTLHTNLSNVMSAQRMSEILEVFKTDLGTYLSSSIDQSWSSGLTTLGTWFTKENESQRLREQNAGLQQQLVAAQTAQSNAEQKALDADNRANESNFAMLLALAVAGVILLLSTPLGDEVKKKLGGS